MPKMTSPFLILILIISFECVIGFAQHPGAYSSPHYAKKNIHYSKPYNQPGPYNAPEYQKMPSIDRFDVAEKSKHQEIELQEKPEVPTRERYQQVNGNDLEVHSGNDTHSRRSNGFMSTFGSFLSGTGGKMLADIAREIVARSTGATSQVGGDCLMQVLSLNLTNLVILVVLKALILAAGMFGAGGWNHNYARSLDDDNSVWIEEKELSLWMGYLEGGDYSCLTRAACETPTMATKYSSGADLLLTGAKLFHRIVPYDKKYENIVEEVKEAAKWGSAGMNCDAKYKCPKPADED